MPVTMKITTNASFANNLAGVSGQVKAEFTRRIRDIQVRMLADAQSAAVAHFHSHGKRPGQYLGAFDGGVKEAGSSVIGWVRNGNPLAHLMEAGFTIPAMTIAPSDALMKFIGPGAREMFARSVKRPETAVRPYPAIAPAFEKHRDEIRQAAEAAVAKIKL